MDEALIKKYSQEIAKLQNELDKLTNGLVAKKKKVFEVRLIAIRETDPINEHLGS